MSKWYKKKKTCKVADIVWDQSLIFFQVSGDWLKIMGNMKEWKLYLIAEVAKLQKKQLRLPKRASVQALC